MSATTQYVYILQRVVEYEGDTNLGVFFTRELAEHAAQAHVDRAHRRHHTSAWAPKLQLQWTRARGGASAPYAFDVSFSVTKYKVQS